jgi:gliding motility-associated-like protein
MTLAGWILVILISGSTLCSAQEKSIFSPPDKTNCPRSLGQADIWYFGDHAGIDFRSGDAVALTDQDVMKAYKSSAVICDSLGNLQCFTNGRVVWGRNFDVMPHATQLAGDLGVTQPAIILPMPGFPDILYIFTVDVLAFKPDNTYTTRGLCYTIIDLTLNGGTGDVGQCFNCSLLPAVSQKLTAVKHRNGKDHWVISHAWDSDEFYAYLLTAQGLSGPVISKTGSIHGGGYADQAIAIGYLKASPDGSRLAAVITGLNRVEVFDFDNSTGDITGTQSYNTLIPGISPYGIEFSPDSKMLYTSLVQVGGSGPPATPSYVMQFNLADGLVNPVVIDSVPFIRLGAMQLGRDGRIYISRTVNLISVDDSLDVIYNPTRSGTACNYNRLNNVAESRFGLQGRASMYSLPNFSQSYVDIPVFTYDSCCYLDATQFHVTNQANTGQAGWDFGDGSTGSGFDPVHQYAQPGTYTVKLTETFNGETFIDSGSVVIYPLPEIELGDTILLYSGASINLRAGGGMQSYLWSTGSVDSIIIVEHQGEYWVRVQDWHCCVNSDTTYVKVFKYYIPNAFTPNGDGVNDYFRIVGLYRNINFRMNIYDRWGQMIFESDDIDKPWDGTFGNKICETGTYVWIAHVEFANQDIVTTGNITLTGTIILLR